MGSSSGSAQDQQQGLDRSPLAFFGSIREPDHSGSEIGTLAGCCERTRPSRGGWEAAQKVLIHVLPSSKTSGNSEQLKTPH
ncbi:hypothetical protein I79_007459 [Cricetulus griseus]|uniref:Uncharacterized protein n=1 Tax=Cricetulus griseus TaxID=10029 RepID=G3HAK3_CRIGR|nr:hypothetical protein I79_007459 [Cricetulus griseus]